MALPQPPVTQQIQREPRRLRGIPAAHLPRAAQLAEAALCPVVDRTGTHLPFGDLFREQRALIVFVRHFLCYTTKEYVEDLAKVPKSFLTDADVRLIVIGQSSFHHIEPFCRLTGYSHEIYVDPEREIYKKLGMKRGEVISVSGNNVHFMHLDSNRMDHMPINSLLDQAGVQNVDFKPRPRIMDV
ncbi:peroxiredoxin-like 2C isoform X2 [Pleurodeles waltl]|uniref:peroxiredoxin-like 2C isoform X2 n=1 Tax=Pleurodeles waltl TaxID=8319 RepID=UPI0037099FAE